MTGWRSSAIVLVLALVLAPLPAGASSDPRPAHRSAALWRELSGHAHKRARLLLEHARANIREGNRQLPADWRNLCTNTLTLAFSDEGSAALTARARALRDLSRQALRKRALLDGALERLERARTLDPDDPELLYAFARALMAWESPGPLWTCTSERRDEQAATALRALRTEHPDFMPETVTFDLAVVQTRRGLFAEAAHAYADAIALALDGDETAVMRANLAEVTMLAGDLEGAVMHYQRALQATHGGRDYLLALWGLAVALDRLGEHDAALEQARKAVEAEGGRMQVLRSDGVFFEPAHEVHAYEGLGHEALAARNEADRARELTRAAASYRAWLGAAGDAHAFSAATRGDLERVQEGMRAQPARIRR
jgi:tetratricopeptide (TPR) repeat protein